MPIPGICMTEAITMTSLVTSAATLLSVAPARCQHHRAAQAGRLLLVFPTRNLKQPAYEAKQTTTVHTVGAPSRKPLTWAAIDWPTAQRTVRRLQVGILQATKAGDGARCKPCNGC
jgi:hypothetical protein